MQALRDVHSLFDREVISLLRYGRYTTGRRLREHHGRDGDHAREWHSTFEFTAHDGGT